ncbi:MAG: LacI family transcriptional regulator [Lachnospiraceae bacterium]|nr:LacI family transcriptional regulator [Lachnospiraceae bacterium]
METITIKDIARICGVGVSTVSRAMNNHPDINEETRVKVMEAIQEYHYIPNNSARNLKRSNSKAIAVLVKGISNPFFSKMIKVFEEEIYSRRYSFILQQVEEREDEIDVALSLVKEKKPLGIIFLGGCFSHSQERLRQVTVPYVLCTVGLIREWEAGICSVVSVDDYKESYRIVDFLCKLGHKRIAIITAEMEEGSIGWQRHLGYEKALKEHGIIPDPALRMVIQDDSNPYTMENGYSITKKLLNSDASFSALFAVSDSIAIGAMRAIHESGKRIPEDYSVIGFDGLDISSYYIPSLTTLKQPAEEMAQYSIRLLFDVIKSRKVHQFRIFSGTLMIGESTSSFHEK